MKKQLCILTLSICLLGLWACNEAPDETIESGTNITEESGTQATEETTTTAAGESTTATEDGTSAADDAIIYSDVADEVQALFENYIQDELVITLHYRDEEHAIEYAEYKDRWLTRSELIAEEASDTAEELRSHAELTETKQTLFDNVVWHEEQERSLECRKELNAVKSKQAYYSFSVNDEEWIFAETSNVVSRYMDGVTYFYTMWDAAGNPVTAEGIEDDFGYLRAELERKADIDPLFTNMKQRGLKVEYNSKYGMETVGIDELVRLQGKTSGVNDEESLNELARTYFEHSFFRNVPLGSDCWYKENISEEKILSIEENIKQGEYYRLFVNEEESWLINSNFQEAIHTINNEKAYYSIWYDTDNISLEAYTTFRGVFDGLMVNGIYNTACVKVSVSATAGLDTGIEAESSISDEELAKQIFEGYKKLYTEVRPDNLYGASDMCMTSVSYWEGIDLDGEEIDEDHKVFMIGYAIKPNAPETYNWFYDYGTGEWEGWIMMGHNFTVDKIDGIWYLTSVGNG